jgi:hypothetical protein
MQKLMKVTQWALLHLARYRCHHQLCFAKFGFRGADKVIELLFFVALIEYYFAGSSDGC